MAQRPRRPARRRASRCENGRIVYEQTWRLPAVTVIAQEASSIKEASNQVLPKAPAIVSCRIVPDQDPEEVFEQLQGVPDEGPAVGRAR